MALLVRAPPRIETERLVLAIGAAHDAPAMAAYLTANREFHAPTAPRMGDDYYTEAHWAARFPTHRDEFERAQSLRLLVRAREAPRGAVLGVANFSNVVWGPFCACFLGYHLDARWEGRGVMHEALSAALAYVFDDLGLHRVMANHLPENVRSARLLRRLGFVPEGYARDYLFIDGAWRDHVLTALTNPRPAPRR